MKEGFKRKGEIVSRKILNFAFFFAKIPQNLLPFAEFIEKIAKFRKKSCAKNERKFLRKFSFAGNPLEV